MYYENHRDDMTHARVWYTQDDHFPPHFHNSIELLYVLQGEIAATLDGREVTVAQGQLLANASYTVHSYSTPVASYAIVAIIPMNAVPSVRALLTAQSFARPVCGDDAEGTLARLMHMMADPATSDLTRKGLCYAVLGLLIDRLGLVEARAGSRAAFIRDVLTYLGQHYAEPLTATGIAAHFGYSRSRFSHLFGTHLGYTLPDYLSALRCQHAATLLRGSDMPVSDVAMAVGFESLRTFYRTFKKQYEMTPNRYAKAFPT